jgi:tyrosine-specific transport protein
VNRQGRLLGAILLISGTTIGAAMLALPVSIGRAGFLPSLGATLFAWAYLLCAALYILEVTLATNMATGTTSNLISMASLTLGPVGRIVSWAFYLFLLYALNTAYIAATAGLFQNMLAQITGQTISHLFCILPLLLAFVLLLRRGMHLVDSINRFMMLGLGVTFLLLIGFSLPHIQLAHLATCNMAYFLPSLSVVVTAFGFHVVIPIVVTYLHGDVKETKRAIIIGSALPLLIYTIWQAATLGLVPTSGPLSIESAYGAGKNGAELLALVSDNEIVIGVSEIFALFVILTSFLGVSLSLFDFLADGLRSKQTGAKWKIFFFTFTPPLYLALSYPHVFFSALEYAGGFGVVVLLGFLPALMSWKRRSAALYSPYTTPGGRGGLLVFMVLSVALVILELLIQLGIVSRTGA